MATGGKCTFSSMWRMVRTDLLSLGRQLKVSDHSVTNQLVSARDHMSASVGLRVLANASSVSVLASNCAPLRFVSFSQRCILAMARPILGPACAGHARAMPARRTMQTLASAGSVSDRLQPTQTVAGAAALKSSRKIRSLTRKESQSSAEPIAPPPASDTKKVAQQDDKQSKEAAQKHV